MTEEDKEKLKGSYKVARKLEKLENKDSRLDSGFTSSQTSLGWIS